MEIMYRIYCEDANRELTEWILNAIIDSYSIIEVTGYYKGTKEKSIIIEVFNVAKRTVEIICQELATSLKQELVVFTECPVTVHNVYGTKAEVIPIKATRSERAIPKVKT